MTIEWIDIVDTTVKIGLGALISGVATYKVASLNHKKDVEKNLINKKIDIIEEITELAEEYFYFFTHLNNKVGAMAKKLSNYGEPLTKSQIEAISEIHVNFVEILSKRNKAISKIKILSITDAECNLLLFNDVLSDYRSDIIFKRTMITEDKRTKLQEQSMLHKDNFYLAISEYLSALGT